ncbi:MAG: RHS repeat-associated core domain-containing protein [Rhodospirillales bacterium]|nr:RHS repeat-associated core domain-containing protein [Rhodospirillales bacterium]
MPTDVVGPGSDANLEDRRTTGIARAVGKSLLQGTVNLASGAYFAGQAKTALGAGWTHNLALSAGVNSDGLQGMAQDSPIDGAAFIAAAYVAQNLLSDPTKPFDKIVVASLVQKWLMDRLIDNTVNVTMGAQAEPFVKLADGSYNPRLGSSSRLSLADGIYSLRNKDGAALTFNAAGHIASWTTPSGAAVSFAYDASTPPLLTGVSNNLGRSLTLSYNAAKQLTSVSDNAGPPRNVTFAYDTEGNLSSSTDPLGNATTYAYTSADGGAPRGLLSQVFYPSSPVPFVTNIYDSLGRVAGQTNASGNTWTYFFAGYRSEEDDPVGTQHVLYYNPRGKALFDIQDYAGLGLVTKFSYDGLDRLSSTVLPGGGGTSYTYATAPNPWANNVATVTRSAASGPLSPTVTSYIYEPTFNKPIQVTDALGRVTAMTYDPWTGNLLSATADVGTAPHFNARTTFSYNVIGLLASTTDPMGTVTRHTYDAEGNRLSTVADAGPGGLNLTTTFAYNARGDAVSVTDPRGNKTISTYDDARRPVSTTTPGTTGNPGGVTTTNTYDPDGRIVRVEQSAAGSVLRTTSSTYTPTGKVATATDANGNVTRYTYDRLDRQATVTDAAGRTTRFTYDAVGRPYQTFNAAISGNALLTRTYTPNGKLATLSDANGYTACDDSNKPTCFAYDGFDRLGTVTYPDTSTEVFTYDALDNVLTRKTRAGPAAVITFAYDTLNRLRTKTPPTGPVVTYGYDLAGRTTSVSDTSTTIPPVAAAVSTTTYTTSYGYDALNRPTAVAFDPVAAATSPAAGELVSFGHSYNPVNQRVGQTISDNTWLSYPAPGPKVSYTANSLNQYTAIAIDGGATVNPTYDNNGNLTSDGSYSYAYDPENRLLTATLGGSTATYSYDAQGRRKSRTVGGTTTIFVTAADNREVLEYDGSTGAVTRWYAYGLGPNDVLGQMNVPAGTRAMPIPDILGSVVGSVDATTGTVTTFGYLPFGGSDAPATPFAFTGQRLDQETGGLYYYRARHYSTVFGRFLQTDPAGYSAGTNLYAYVGSDPLNLADPDGLSARRAIEGTYNSLASWWQAPITTNYLQMDPMSCAVCTQRPEFATAGDYASASYQQVPFTRGDGAMAIAATAAMVLPGAGPFGRATTAETTTLFRAVNRAELADIAASGGFRNLGQASGKYFSTTAEGAGSYARQTFGTGLYEGPYTVVQTSIPSRLISADMRATVDRGISTVVVPDVMLRHLTMAKSLNYTPFR